MEFFPQDVQIRLRISLRLSRLSNLAGCGTSTSQEPMNARVEILPFGPRTTALFEQISQAPPAGSSWAADNDPSTGFSRE